MDRRESTKAAHAGPIRPPGYHGRPYRHRDPAVCSRNAPSRCRRPARDGKGDKGVGLPTTDIPAHHPVGERHHRNLHSDLAASHHSPLPQRKERDGPPIGFFVDLRRQKHLPPNLYCQALLQGHILAIPDPDAPTGISPLLTPPYSAVPVNSQQRAMLIQVLLFMVQDRLSKEEATELLDQRVHVLTSTQELRHSTRNFVKLAGDYVGEGSHVCVLMASCPRHIDRFNRQYDKAFARGPLFGADLIDCIHKRVQVFLNS